MGLYDQFSAAANSTPNISESFTLQAAAIPGVQPLNAFDRKFTKPQA